MKKKFFSDNHRQNIEDQLSKLRKADISLEYFTSDILQLFSTAVKTFELAGGDLPSIPGFQGFS